MKNKYLAFNGLSIARILFAIFLLWWFIFNCYPTLVRLYLIIFETGYIPEKDILGRGTYGDMYGALNTFFSGLAFVGLLVTIFLQIIIHEREEELRKDNEHKEKKERLIFLKEISCQVVAENSKFIEKTKNFLPILQDDFITKCYFKSLVIPSIYVFVREKLSSEKYFLAYIDFATNDTTSITKLLLQLEAAYSDMENFYAQHAIFSNLFDRYEREYAKVKYELYDFIKSDGVDSTEMNRVLGKGTQQEVFDFFKKVNFNSKNGSDVSKLYENLISTNAILRSSKANLVDAFKNTLESMEKSNNIINENLITLNNLLLVSK
ncbi:MAG: hypothetical protein ACOVQ4_12475 [Flectobacillus sp.]|uniref:hypothetical protein n=1 Tax=Flectobacillus sp. TaxID=50419 RepID=UPI003B9A3C6B